jgi:hypothetical protein
MTKAGEQNPQALRARYAACVAMDLRDESAALGNRLGVPVAEQQAHLAARPHALDEWQPEQFDQFAALPPGRFDPRIFEQTTWWVDILRRPHRITDRADLTDDHLLAVIGFILREAWRWSDFPDLRNDDLVNVEWFHAEASRRIQHTPLFKVLVGEAERRGLDVP